jgi:hypothetical protein
MPRRRPPKGYRFFRREFLNREGFYLGAHILAVVNDNDTYARVNIADCDRVVRLEFDAENSASLRNSVQKLDLLIGTLTAVRQELLDGYLPYRERQAAQQSRRQSS